MDSSKENTMRRYTYAFLRDYFSTRGLTLSRSGRGKATRYTLTNGVKTQCFICLADVIARASKG